MKAIGQAPEVSSAKWWFDLRDAVAVIRIYPEIAGSTFRFVQVHSYHSVHKCLLNAATK
jgi:hypothetical protein